MTDLNNDRADLAVAINFESQPDQEQPPEWVELVPAGVIIGRDGRRWINDRPDSIIEAFNTDGKDMVIDWEHASIHKAPRGDQAPASGWITALQNRNGAIWGRVEWTATGRQAVTSRSYRYISPTFVFERETNRIIQLLNAGLTNSPNLKLAALNNQQEKQENVMKNLLKKLGLPETADEAAALNAVQKLKSDLAVATNRAETPSLDKFVPRGDYDQALARASNAEKSLAEREKADLETAVNQEIDAALKAGKITPATKDFYISTCQKQGGLDQFREFVKTAPVIGGPSGLDEKPPKNGTEETALNAEEKAIVERLGIYHRRILKNRLKRSLRIKIRRYRHYGSTHSGKRYTGKNRKYSQPVCGCNSQALRWSPCST